VRVQGRKATAVAANGDGAGAMQARGTGQSCVASRLRQGRGVMA